MELDRTYFIGPVGFVFFKRVLGFSPCAEFFKPFAKFRFFIGDTGVMSLGFTLGVVALLTNTALLLPLIAIIPLIESLSVILQTASKKLRHKKLFPSTPIHHTSEAMGWPESQITMRFWMINALGAIIGLIIFLVDSKIPPLFR